MDPITAAGIGLSITSLAFQVFAGCIKGYEMFINMKGMPVEYEYLRTRLRIEQCRCLHWGEKVGLVEDLLDEPSKLLQWNQNLVIEILQEIQRSFRSCLAMTAKFDPYTEPMPQKDHTQSTTTPKTKRTALQKILSVWDRGGRLVGRLEWVMLSKGSFEKLVTKLIQYNDRIESLLDRSALEDVRAMQAQSNLVLLQMTDQVDQLRILVQALHVQGGISSNGGNILLHDSSAESDAQDEGSFAALAAFKVQHLRIQLGSYISEATLIPFESIMCEDGLQYSGRQMARLQDRRVWLEWRETADKFLKQSAYLSQIESRILKLVAILTAPDRPQIFRAPECIGYTKAVIEGTPRYALVNAFPNDAKVGITDFLSLRDMLGAGARAPSLNARVELAAMLAVSILYLHAIDWIHKDIRSDNILFVREDDGTCWVSQPLLAGFEFSRPAMPEEITGTHAYTLEQALYRHPDLLEKNVNRSSKSHDIYSLGLVLAEIALWKPIEDIVRIEVRRSRLVQVQSLMLERRVTSMLYEAVGRRFGKAIISCLNGSFPALASDDQRLDEERPEVGAEMARIFCERVVQELKAVKV